MAKHNASAAWDYLKAAIYGWERDNPLAFSAVAKFLKVEATGAVTGGATVKAAYAECVRRAEAAGKTKFDLAKGGFYAALHADLTAVAATYSAGSNNTAVAVISNSADDAAEDFEPEVAPEPVANTGDPANALEDAIRAIAKQVSGPAKIDAAQVRAICKDMISDAVAAIPARVIELRASGEIVAKVEGVSHPMMETLLRVASTRLSDGHRPNIWISGPAGSGKTSGALKTFEALKLRPETNGALSMAHEVLGFIDATGAYRDTAFFRGYTGACGYLFDDIDGSTDNSPLLALNAALANGHASFPHGLHARNADSLIIATANTWGLGANADYVGRIKLDAAFLDRFHVKLFWDYDEKFERALFGAHAADITQPARRIAREKGLKALITPRCTAAVAALLAAGFTSEEAKNLTYRASLTPDQRNMLP